MDELRVLRKMNLHKIPKLYFYRFLLVWLPPIYKRIFKLRSEGLENVPGEGPFLIVGNHSHKLDPFFIGAVIRRPIFQMASNEYFRIPLMRRFMWAMGAFPFEKYASVDIGAIRHAIRLVRDRGYPLAIYPEGGRNWDGKTLPILQATANMVKHLGVPVVAAVSKGNYIAWPRWANMRRKCPITIHFAKPVIFDKDTSDKEIIGWMQKALDHNDNYTNIEWMRGKQPAEGLTRLLWRCPKCRTLEGLIEKGGDTLVCSQCGKQWEVNLNCMIREVGSDSWKPIKEYADLMFREEEIFPVEYDIGDHLENGEQVYLQSGEITLYDQPRYPRLRKIDNGKLLLTNRGLVFIKKSDEKSFRYSFEKIRGSSVEKNYIFQVGMNNKKIGRFEMQRESCPKWEYYFDYVRKINRNKLENEKRSN
jgi:1-acyl-sn-glycerol-3-phosphate acyltransferase